MTMITTIPIACFFCGIDSKYLIWLVVGIVMSMILSTVSFFIWSFHKQGKSTESVKYSIFSDDEDL